MSAAVWVTSGGLVCKSTPHKPASSDGHGVRWVLGCAEPRRVLSSDYMCCNASWACSVYTSSFPAHEPISNCALLCKLRCLSREKKLNLRGQREDSGHGFNGCVRLHWFPCISCLCSSVRVLHLTAMYYVTHLPISVSSIFGKLIATLQYDSWRQMRLCQRYKMLVMYQI